MTVIDIEIPLTDVEADIRDTAHRFAEEVLRPAGTALDRMADPADVIAPGSVLWDVLDKYRQLGFDELEEQGGDLDPVRAATLRAIITEELAWGDSGLALSLGISNFHRILSRMSGNPALIERFCQPGGTEIGCWAVTEPDHGSDSLTFTEPHFRDPAIRANCVARREGDEFVINGQKSAWVSNGSIADVASLFCTVDNDQGFSHGAVIMVPLDSPGVSRGKPLDKLGQRALNQGEIVFDGVRVPADYLLVGPEGYPIIVEMVLAFANAAMGATFVGVARAAFEHALDYAKERVQGGVPIFEHQSVKARLFRMFSQVEAARALARRVQVYNGTQVPLVQYSIASKVFCTNTAFSVASDAVQMFGGNGLSREYPVEKLMRDARAAMIEDGCNDVLGLMAAAKL